MSSIKINKEILNSYSVKLNFFVLILINRSSMQPATKTRMASFKFEQFWVRISGFNQIVGEAWDLFSFNFFCEIDNVAVLFVFNKYYLIID